MEPPRAHLLLAFVVASHERQLFSLLATLAVGGIAMHTTWQLGYHRTLDQLSSVSALKQAELESYRDSLFVDLTMIADEPYVTDLLQDTSLDTKAQQKRDEQSQL